MKNQIKSGAISKTKFINYIRCPRYYALDEIYYPYKRKANQSNNEFLEEERIREKQEEYCQTLSAIESEAFFEMFDEEDNDKIEIDKTQLETLMPYFNKIEKLAEKAIFNKFSQNNIEPDAQELFEASFSGLDCYCFLDSFLDYGDTFSVFEVKASTTNKFLKLGYKEEGELNPIFTEKIDDPQVLVLKERYDKTWLENKKYYENRQKLFNRLDDCGKYVYDLAFQRFVIEHSSKALNYDIGKAKYYLAVLNRDYVHDGKRDEENNDIYPDTIISFVDLTDITKELQAKIENDFLIVKEYIQKKDAGTCPISENCQHNKIRECQYKKKICFNKLPKETSIFCYRDGHRGFGVKEEKKSRFDLINEGIFSALDVPYELLTRKNNQIQREVLETGIEYINHKKIKDGLKKLEYPIYHLDFETFPCPLPRYKGEKCYFQSLFQYSVHIEKEPDDCSFEKNHYGYLAKNHDDIREELLISLCECVKDKGTVLVYNQAFEKTRLQEMADLYPHLREKLINIKERIFDLLYVLRSNTKFYKDLGYLEEEAKLFNYYHQKQDGSFSIKYIGNIFGAPSYSELKVKNGTQAFTTYEKYLTDSCDKDLFSENYQALWNYCKQDTWSMVVVLRKLRELVKYSL